MLVEQRPAAVSKAAIHQQLWPDTFVSDGNVAVLVADIRRALGDNARRPLFVRTIHRFGYAFVAAAAEVERSTTLVRSATTCWLASGQRAHPASSSARTFSGADRLRPFASALIRPRISALIRRASPGVTP